MLKKLVFRLNNLPRDTRDTLFLLLVIVWILLPQTTSLPVWCSALAGAVLLWRGWLALQSKALPGKWWLLAILAVTLGATLMTYKTLLGRDAGVTLLVVLLSLKTLELRGRRDAFVVFFLGFFCMLANFFYSQSLLTALSMVIGLLGLLTALVNAHMPVGKPPLMQAAKTAGWMTLAGAPIMVVLFMLFPRLAPLWGVPSDAMTGRSGLSAAMQVGTIASLALDDSVALRIRFEGPPPPQRELYFRGPVLSSFDGKEWRSPQGDGFSPRFGLTPSLVVSGTATSYEVTMEPTSRPWLFLMEAAASSPEVPGFRASMQPDLQWLVNRPVTELLRYKAQSHGNFTHGPLTNRLALREFVELPPGFNPRTLAFASQLRADPKNVNASNLQLVEIAMNQLRTGGYVYTLEPGVYGANTADEFWFDRKEGFCEHIASSFVILMRALDVPARIVTGYQGGERNGLDGFWVVRQSDAHAWAEVWEQDRGWVRVDPTSAVSPGRTGAFQRLLPPQGAVQKALGGFNPSLMRQVRAGWEAINNSWNQRILNYTQNRQLDLLKNLGFKSPSWEDLSYLLLGIVVCVSLVGAGWSLWDRSQHDPWLRLLAKARRKLGAMGIQSTAATSPRQLASQLRTHSTDKDNPQIRALHDWLMQLEMQRYAHAANDAPASKKQILQLRRQFNQLIWPA